MSGEMTVWDRLAGCYGKPLYQALWARAWGDQYPADVAPHSSCTKELLDRVQEEVHVPADGTLGDVGCGVGGVGLWLAKVLHARVEGVDCSSRAIEIARQRVAEWELAGRASFTVGDFSRTGLPSASVDAVISIDALPFAADIDAALAETRRILRSSGRLVFTAREAPAGTRRCAELGESWHLALGRNGFELQRAMNRPDVSSLWRRLYEEWTKHEQQLRAELSEETVDMMIEEARENTPRLDEDRPWLLITAVAVA
jgi:ubiquinone/menaquinone biosynthesis C-methylase UbiE